MIALLRVVDQVLRGGYTAREDLSAGRVSVSIRSLLAASLLLGASYGAFMGLYGVTRPANESFLQLVATAVKVPLLFVLTLIVTFPSLYVFSAL